MSCDSLLSCSPDGVLLSLKSLTLSTNPLVQDSVHTLACLCR